VMIAKYFEGILDGISKSSKCQNVKFSETL
jgi:hypothetical protein